MSQETHAFLRHQIVYGSHRKPLHHDNALADIGPEALLLLRRHGAELVVAEGHTVHGFALSETEAHVRAKPTWRAQLPEPPIAIADASAGVLATWTAEGRTFVGLIRVGVEEVVEVVVVPGHATALAAARDEALLAVRVPESSAGRLLRIDISRGAVLAERPLVSSDVDLQLDPAGRWLVVTDRVAGTVCTAPTSLATWPDATPMQQAVLAERPSTPARREDAEQWCHPNPCCCHRCAPDGNRGGSGSGQPGGTGQGGTGAGGGWCQPGGAGVPSGDGGTVVGHGGSVGHQGPGDGGPISCWLDLLWPIHRLVRTSSYAVAVDASYRNMAIIGLDPFRVVEERQFGRSGFRFALDREAPVMVVRNLARSGGATAFEVLDLAAANLLADPISGLVSGIVPLDSATFYGGFQVESLMSGHAPPNGPIRVLLLPVIEGAQTFSDPDISHFAAYLDRTLAPHVHDYYVENSYGALNNISFNVFGRDVLSGGGPLQLPRTHLADYYWPAYDPAKLILTRAGIPAGSQIVFDGRESMQITVQPDGGLPPSTLNVQFAALGFSRLANLFPVEVRFDPADRLVLQVTTPSGSNLTLTLQFTANTINLTDDANLNNELDQIASYLDGIFQAAETSAGLTSRLFARPVVRRLIVPGNAFGKLVVTVAGAVTAGPKLAVHSANATVSGVDPIGLGAALVGAMDPASPGLRPYLNFLFAIAEANQGFDNATRRVDDVDVAFDPGTRTLTTTVQVGTVVGGPTASISLASSSGLADLFTSTSTQPNSATTYNNKEALRDGRQLYQDAWSAAVRRLQDAGRDPRADLSGWQVAMVFPVEAAVNRPGDPDSVQPWEMWNVTPLYRPLDAHGYPFNFRGQEWMLTVQDAADTSIQLQAVWTLDFFTSDGKPDIALICHELGHGIGFRDLYQQTGYREDLAYLGDWAIMCNHWNKPHHAGYHKQQAGWITDDRVITIPPTQPDQTTNTEALLVPVELWDGGYPADSRAAFGAGPNMPVVQLIRLDLGGDGAVYDLIEARQTGAQFSQLLPTSPGILITNALEPWDDQRYAFNDAYRRELQLLNPNNILANPGDSFDLARAAGLPAAGITVTVLDRKLVRGANVFHIKVTRTNTNFIDLYFANADPYYKNPDLYVDWAGDNPSRNASDHDGYPIGSPVDQGDAVRVPRTGTELHWVVARLRNRGQVHAEQVKLNFKMCVPPGGGDRSGNFQLIGSVTLPDVQGGDVPIDGVLEWDVTAGFGGHTCLAVEIADYKIPLGSDGSALATDDVWIANNHAQKNVDQFIPLQSSPYEPVDFDYSVHNDAPRPEYAYLEPDGLPYGMKLTVTPRGQVVPPKSTVIFRCRLELDDAIVDAGCRSDRQFRLVTWRRDPESTTRWGGVQYKVMPRKRCAVTLTGWWDYANMVHLDGKVNPDPGGGILRLRLAFAGTDAVWVPLPLGAGGVFTWQGAPVGGARSMNAVAAFEGNMLYGPAESPLLELQQPPPIG